MTTVDAVIIALCVLGTIALIVSAAWIPKSQREEQARNRAEVDAAWAELRRGDAEIARRRRRLLQAAGEES